jgi:hypothetical protein
MIKCTLLVVVGGWLASSLIIAYLRELKDAPLVIPLEIS